MNLQNLQYEIARVQNALLYGEREGSGMKIVLIVAGAVTGALLIMVLLAGIAVSRAGECMETTENEKM